MKPRAPLAVGDRVRVYGNSQMSRIPADKMANNPHWAATVLNANVGKRGDGWVNVKADKPEAIGVVIDNCVTVHRTQCRRLRKKPKAEAERDEMALTCLAEISGAGICTPVEGYVKASFLLASDLRKLCAEA